MEIGAHVAATIAAEGRDWPWNPGGLYEVHRSRPANHPHAADSRPMT